MSLYDKYEPIGRVCAVCGKRFFLMCEPGEYAYRRIAATGKRSGKNPAKKPFYFCRYSCMREFDRIQEEKNALTCPNCGKKFRRQNSMQKYCCEDCRRSYVSRKYWERKKRTTYPTTG